MNTLPTDKDIIKIFNPCPTSIIDIYPATFEGAKVYSRVSGNVRWPWRGPIVLDQNDSLHTQDLEPELRAD